MREVAVVLRRRGHTYAEICAELGVSRSSCSLWLRGVEESGPATPAAAQLSFSSRAQEARRLRRDGLPLQDVATCLGVSVKTVWDWCLDLPVPRRAGRSAEEMRRLGRERWDRVLAERERERQQVKEAAASSVGMLSPRELELAAVTAYWAEGSKSKPWDRRERVSFINSDPGLLRIWLAWLDQEGVAREDRRYCLSIHEGADLEGATRYWCEQLGLRPEDVGRPTLKRDGGSPGRLNTGRHYHGCVVVRLVKARTL